MKFVLVVLTIHFIGEMIAGKVKNGKNEKVNNTAERVIHPAEFTLR